MQTRAHIPPTRRYEKRGTKDTIQGNWGMAVMGGGDAAGGKRNNQLPPLGANIATHHGVSQALITGYEVEVRCCGSCCFSNENHPSRSLARKRGGGQGII